MNNLIINKFEDLILLIRSQNDNTLDDKTQTSNKFRLIIINKVLNIIKKYPIKITLNNYKELGNINGVGKGSLDRIKEILETDNLTELIGFIDNSKEKTKQKAIEELENIIGIGKVNATKYYNMGITSIKILKDKIKNKMIKVNDKIILGLKYHEKYQMNIPRNEMDLYYIFFKKLINKFNKKLDYNINNEYIFEICGSYRREKPFSNDIDVLITKKGTTDIKKNHLERFVNKLKKPLKSNNNKPLIVDSMTDKKIKTKYMGFSELGKNFIRRIDIRFVSYSSYYYALLYFTGSSDFNQKIRAIAKKKGYKLNEYGLYDKNNNNIEVSSERNIFEKLDIPYVSPELR